MLTGVIAFLLLLIAVLAIPVTLTFQVSWPRAFQNDIELQWGFGFVRVRIPAPQSKEPSPEGEEAKRKKGRFGRSSRGNRNFLAAARSRKFRRRIIKFVSDLWHAAQKKDISLRVRVGLGDPADTGQIWAILGPVSVLLTNVQEASIRIEPEFFDTTFELDSSGSIRLIPLQLIYLAVALLLSPPVWQVMKQTHVAGR